MKKEMTNLEKLQAADKILAGSKINTGTLVESLTRDGFATTSEENKEESK